MSVRRSSSGPDSTPNDFVPFPAAVALLGSVDGGNTFSAVPLNAVPGGLSVNTSVDLTTLADLPIGAVVYVRSRGRAFQCVPVGAGEISGSGCAWKSNPETSSVAWLAQATWSIDAVNGDDDASGVDDAHALQTFAEFYARMGGASWVWSQSVVIRVLSDCDAIVLDFRFDNAGLSCEVVGVSPAPLVAGKVSAWTGFVAAANQSARLSIDAVADMSAWVNFRVRIVGGARNGAVSWIAESNPDASGANVAAVPQGFKLPSPWNSNVVSPAVNDDVVVESLRAVPVVMVRALAVDTTLENTICPVVLRNLNIEVLDVSTVTASLAGCHAFGCYVHYCFPAAFEDSSAGTPAFKLLGCRLNPDVLGNVYSDGCLISQTAGQFLQVVGTWQCGHDLVQGPYVIVQGAYGFMYVANGSLGIQQVASTFGGGCLRIQEGGKVYVASNLYGKTPVNVVGVNLGGNSSLLWNTSRPTLTGASGDVRVNGITAGTRPVVSWVSTGGIWNDGMLQGTAQLGAGGFVDVTIPSWLSSQSIGVSYRTPGAAAGVLSVPLANRTAGGFRIVGAAADTTSTVDWLVGSLGAQQFIGKL